MMQYHSFSLSAALSLVLISCAFTTVSAQREDLGNGFLHHGVATPVSNHRGTVATVDGDGRNVVLVWLFDHRGGYALLVIDAMTGRSDQIPVPFPPGGDCPYASILSSGNKYYTHFNSYFCEFDPAQRSFTFHQKTAPQMAMGMTEDDDGLIWSVTYPNSGVVSFDPKTRAFTDFGHVHKENWRQYQRSVAADDTGYLYFSIGSTKSHIIGFDPKTGLARPMIAESERGKGTATLYRDLDGKVYGQPVAGQADNWYELYAGVGRKIGRHEAVRRKPIITSSQGLFHTAFADGKQLKKCDLVNRRLVVADPASATTVELDFDYTSEGAHIMGIAAAPNDTVAGGTAFPMRFFNYDPEKDAWTNRASYGQWNTVARQGKRFFVGGYSGGFLLEWDPAEPWVPTVKGSADGNPRFHTKCTPTIMRPHDLLAHPDGKTLVLAGTPGYGYTGGGLFFWDRQTQTGTLVEHTDLLPEHSTMSLAALPGGKLLGGTTVGAGTGGEQKAAEAELYILDLDSKRIEWHEPVFPAIHSFNDLCLAPSGLCYGFADRTRLFVFDPVARKVVHQEETGARFGPTNSQQGPRVFVEGSDRTIYVLFAKGIATIDPESFEVTMLAESPVPIGPGGALLKGRIYFGSGSHLYSYAVPEQ